MPLSVTPLVLNGMHQPVQPRIRPLKPCQEDQACPDVPPQPGVHEHARPPPGMRRRTTKIPWRKNLLVSLVNLVCLVCLVDLVGWLN